ncbi:glucose-1-phosphatase-like [Nymphalis io]|uniref:glucose-1-phosphatase-like n=1 Tax=Inachis io TaxID=171585 RepID=UPI00216A06D2|nr:glucose-1-phosphatase-like [Nymphalis io]
MRDKREFINTLCFILICVISQVIVFVFIFFSNVSTMRLDQVVILSRHNVRTPLSKNLGRMTPQPWPHFKERPGYLTEKGFVLEGYMGRFFFNWLHNEGVISKSCPTEEEFYVYANSMQRTLFSAQAFINNAFPNCNIIVHHTDVNKTDQIFSPIIHNSSTIFKDIALKEMKNVLDNLNLEQSYKAMENILNYEYSDFCKQDKECDMATDKNKLEILVGKKPKLSGPLKICNEAIDYFLMSYYNGFPMEDVAWGKLNDIEKWHSILDLTAGYHNVTFNTTHVSKDIARPLLKYMTNILIDKKSNVVLLMGHDANINVILNAMSFKSYNLPDSFVSTPIGGKIVFQKWFNRALNKYFLKINYVYQTNKQLRDGDILSLKSPPNFALLELKYCETDNNGFCLWDDFIRFLNKL